MKRTIHIEADGKHIRLTIEANSFSEIFISEEKRNADQNKMAEMLMCCAVGLATKLERLPFIPNPNYKAED